MNNEKRLYGLAIAKLNMLFTSMWVILHFIIVAAWQLHTNRWRQCDTLTPLATHKIYGRCEGRTICAKNGGGKNKKRPWKTIIYLTLFRFYFAFSMSPVPHVVWHSLTLFTHTFRSYIFCFFFCRSFQKPQSCTFIVSTRGRACVGEKQREQDVCWMYICACGCHQTIFESWH